MFRPVLLLASVGILACCVAIPPGLDRCSAVFCQGVNREDCPGEYLPYQPPERCCSVCTVYKDVNESCARTRGPIFVECKSPYVCKNNICSD